jgi:2-phospho-L-lactate guanylyltransferase
MEVMTVPVYALIPVNKLDEAKTRLSGMLSAEEREELVLNMLQDVLSALEGIETVVVSPTDIRDSIDYDFHFIFEEKKEGLNAAVKKAAQYAIEKGAEATLFVPADTPLLTQTHVKEIIELGEKHSLIISPSSRGGTGILYRRPPSLIDCRFTSTSFSDHEKEARKRGVEMHIYDSFAISLDIDVPEDILEFLLHGKGTKTHDFLVRVLEFPLE